MLNSAAWGRVGERHELQPHPGSRSYCACRRTTPFNLAEPTPSL